MTVTLTAYNDEDSIGAAVQDFLQHPLVKRVIVVSNNSTDYTVHRAQEANAIVFNESLPGYGHCVYRCLTEAVQYDDTELIVLCEGDLTFRAHDLEKFLAYIAHADIVAVCCRWSAPASGSYRTLYKRSFGGLELLLCCACIVASHIG